MNKDRPVNLALTTISLPLAALTSIMHRISGVVLFIGIALFVWLLHQSLASPEGFAEIKAVMSHFLAKIVLWAVCCALAYHLVAGIKHLIMDLGIGETVKGGKMGAQLTLIISAVLFIVMGVWIW